MEGVKFKRDETPYLIFKCSKCNQYSYVKTTQKTKKCLRCGYSHQVSKILNHGHIVNGVSNAVNRVKDLQGEYGLKELKREPDFISEGSFKISTSSKKPNTWSKNSNRQDNDEDDKDLYVSFIQMLNNLSELFKTFPKYIIEIMAENNNIPQSKVSKLIIKAMRDNYLSYHNDNYSIKK